MSVIGPFMYKWTQISTGMWYVGIRIKKGCHINDGYICSSKKVKPMILKEPKDWERKILAIGDPQYITNLESEYLKLNNAKHNNMSFNMHNGDGNFTNYGSCHSEQTRKKISLSNKGKHNRIPTLETRIKMSKSRIMIKRLPLTDEQKEKMSKAMKNKPWTEARRLAHKSTKGIKRGRLTEEEKYLRNKKMKDKKLCQS